MNSNLLWCVCINVVTGGATYYGVLLFCEAMYERGGCSARVLSLCRSGGKGGSPSARFLHTSSHIFFVVSTPLALIMFSPPDRRQRPREPSSLFQARNCGIGIVCSFSHGIPHLVDCCRLSQYVYAYLRQLLMLF